jgi:hypothetical protein
MTIHGVILAGFAATIVLTTVMSASQGLGFTRMSIPFLVGTIFTPSRDRAMVVGTGVHIVNGMLFALIYAALFHQIGRASVALGAAMGFVHGAFVLTVGMVVLPGLHPHMVSAYHGPTPNRLLQPPGFLALHYGRGTPLATMIAHVIYGAILGGLYRV